MAIARFGENVLNADSIFVFSFTRMKYESWWMLNTSFNRCGTANHGYDKVSEALSDMDLQQSHIHFEIQI